ncbi:DNA-binding domain-containing protein, AraC-type [Opitutaceae bacterium TAV1]|nr:DNA-binding domain-containing protein, AraC-type [Opitutaceae bacterium TAV1]
MDKGGDLMDKINPDIQVYQARHADLLSPQVTESRYFFPNLAPSPGGRGVAVTLGGRERCRSDYDISRRSYAYHGIEYVAEGAGWVELAGLRQALRPGSVYAYAPDTRCAIRTDPKQPMLKYFVCASGAGLRPRIARAGLGNGRARVLAAHAEIRSVMEDLIREGQRSGPLAPAICAQLFELLLLKIEDGARWEPAGDHAWATFQKCKALIDAEAEHWHTLTEVARAAGIEESSVCRLFRRFQGTSPYQYLLRRKMNIAAEFLVETGGLVKEAAQRVGFDDPYHFSRCFKAVHGIAPRELLRQGRAEPAEASASPIRV